MNVSLPAPYDPGHERTARIEARIVVLMAALGLASVAFSAWIMGVDPGGAPAPATALAAPSESVTGERTTLEEPLALLGRSPPALSALAAPAEDEGLAPAPSARPVKPIVKEKDFYAGYRAQLAQDAATLEDRARGILEGTGPDCEKVALLRALCDGASERAGELFAHALAVLPDEPGLGGESVPRTAIRCLRERARRDEKAREILRALAEGPQGERWSGVLLASAPEARSGDEESLAPVGE